MEKTFAPSTKGFFYIRTPPNGAPMAAASLRFRVTDSADPKSFDAGHDLLYMGLPFNVPFVYESGQAAEYFLARHFSDSKYVLKYILRSARFLFPQLPLAMGWRSSRATSLIYAKRQPFLFKFGGRDISPVWLIQGAGGKLSCFQFPVPSVALTKEEYQRAGLPIAQDLNKKVPLYNGMYHLSSNLKLYRLCG